MIIDRCVGVEFDEEFGSSANHVSDVHEPPEFKL